MEKFGICTRLGVFLGLELMEYVLGNGEIRFVLHFKS